MSVYKKDRAEWLSQAIDSILHQSTPSDDIIIVIDGPLTFELNKTVQHYHANSTITIVRLKKNRGLGNALNIGIAKAKHELIARMDADDVATEKRCELQVAKFRESPNIDIIGGQIAEFVDNPDNIVAYRKVPLDHDGIKQFSRRRSPFNHPTVMFRKSVIQEIGGYDVSAIRIEDYDLWLRALASGAQCVNLDTVLLYYRSTQDAMKRRKTFTSFKNHIQARARFYNRKHISLMDFTYGVITQTTLFVIPASFADKLFKKAVRHEQ